MTVSPDVTELLHDPELGGGRPFYIVRRHENRVTGQRREEWLEALGNVQAAGQDALAQLPEGDRYQGVKVFRTDTLFQMGSDQGEWFTYKDEIRYKGKAYTVLAIDDWQDYGMHFAYGTQMGEE